MHINTDTHTHTYTLTQTRTHTFTLTQTHIHIQKIYSCPTFINLFKHTSLPNIEMLICVNCTHYFSYTRTTGNSPPKTYTTQWRRPTVLKRFISLIRSIKWSYKDWQKTNLLTLLTLIVLFLSSSLWPSMVCLARCNFPFTVPAAKCKCVHIFSLNQFDRKKVNTYFALLLITTQSGISVRVTALWTDHWVL